MGVTNRELGTIQQIGVDGTITVRMGSSKERTVTLDPRAMRHFDHGYAVTSHSSQGLTSERVLVNIDTGVHPGLINSRFAYVSVSRASHDAQIFTNDATRLSEILSKDVTRASAIDFRANRIPQASVELKQPAAPKKTLVAGLHLSL